MEKQAYPRRAIAAGIVLGIGLGGFIDGILLHMILQWHNMLSNIIPPHTMEAMRVNMLGDGLFHAFTWTLTVVGLFLLWSVAKSATPLPSTLSFIGLLLTGFGLFNLVEGIIDHHLLALHHVREVPDPLAWDLGFLAIGGVLITAVGWTLVRVGRRPSTDTQPAK